MRNYPGEEINNLTLVKVSGRSKNRSLIWECLCECGKICNVSSNALNRNHTKSCGCLVKKTLAKRKTHGMTNTKFYQVWKTMKSRCSNPNATCYENYGGKGIKVCGEWADFEAFHRDMFSGYKEGLQLDREDNDSDYNKDNCRWVTPIENANNKSNNATIEYKGEKYTKSQLARKYNMPLYILKNRLGRGMSVKECIETPIKRRKNNE